MLMCQKWVPPHISTGLVGWVPFETHIVFCVFTNKSLRGVWEAKTNDVHNLHTTQMPHSFPIPTVFPAHSSKNSLVSQKQAMHLGFFSPTLSFFSFLTSNSGELQVLIDQPSRHQTTPSPPLILRLVGAVDKVFCSENSLFFSELINL